RQASANATPTGAASRHPGRGGLRTSLSLVGHCFSGANPFDAGRRVHDISIATAVVVVASSSGSVIGVDCRYSTFGLSAKTAAAAIDAAAEPVSASTIDV